VIWADGEAFWNQLDALIVKSTVVIDRPKGSAHPRYADVIYPLDYGYLEGTTSGDGQGIDVWVGSDSTRQISAVICTIDGLKQDAEIKVLIGCSEGEVDTIMRFFEANDIGCLLVRRDTRS
jgi:inorganic pyrophosphatase